MSTLTLSEVTKFYEDRCVLNRVSFQLPPGEKAGLVGPNGSGKSTILKIINGELETDAGHIHLSWETSLGYLPQEPRPPEGGTLRSLLEHSLRDLFRIKKELACLEKNISSHAATQDNLHTAESNLPRQQNHSEHPKLNEMLERYTSLRENFEERGGYQIEGRIASVAQGLGFTLEDMEGDVSHFSGGEIMRARLAALLLQEPDFLLLDEPTNFLDIYGLEWLEKYLRDWTGALLVVSHDRYFLDRVVGRIFHLQKGNLKKYRGNYSSFIQQKEQEDLTLQRTYAKQQAKIQKEKKLIREAKGDERSKRQAHSRQKKLDKIEMTQTPEKTRTFKPGFSFQGRSGKLVISLDNINVQFGEHQLFQNLALDIYEGDRIALVGPNGSGKSTLLKIITGEIKPAFGNVKVGPSVKFAYFSQEQEQLNQERTVLEEVTESGNLTPKEARNHLGAYLFQGEDVFKNVGSLSSGEKSRLALALMALQDGNCLLMDEPTSHLDLPALEELEQALQSYPGTLIVVSHDRYFLNTLVNRVIELDGSKAYSYPVSYTEYLEKRKQQQTQAESKKQPLNHNNHHMMQKQQMRQAQNQQKKFQKKQEQVENLITEKENELTSLEQQLSDPQHYGDFQGVKELNDRLQRAREDLASYLQQWEEISLELEKIEQYLQENTQR